MLFLSRRRGFPGGLPTYWRALVLVLGVALATGCASMASRDAAADALGVDAALDVARMPSCTPSDACPPTDLEPAEVLPMLRHLACDDTTVTDLGPFATGPSGSVDYLGDTTSSDATNSFGYVFSDFSGMEIVNGRALRYVPPNDEILRVSTNNPGTDSRFHVCAAVFDQCGTGGRILGSVPPRVAVDWTCSFALPVHAGVPITIIVGSTGRDTGSFELTLAPSVLRPPGATCDRCGALNACAPGSVCDNTCEGVCAPDGARNGRCRTGSVPCDSGLACSDDPSNVTSRCRPFVRLGSRCAGLPVVCEPGTACVAEQGICVLSGAPGSSCRPSDPPCDTGLTCLDGVCGIVTDVGSYCNRPFSVCVPGSSCIRGLSTCIEDGAAQGRCRSTGAPCDPGLTCLPDVQICAGLLPVGAPCGLNNGSECKPGEVCNSDVPSVCAWPGSAATPCRSVFPFCDPGLECLDSPWGRLCLHPLALGSPCTCAHDEGCIEGVCASAPRGTPLMCVPSGSLGAPCYPNCQRGLRCETMYYEACFGRSGGCLPGVPEGGSCALDSLSCDDSTSCVDGICQLKGSPGAACRVRQPVCDVGLSCVDGTCE